MLLICLILIVLSLHIKECFAAGSVFVKFYGGTEDSRMM